MPKQVFKCIAGPQGLNVFVIVGAGAIGLAIGWRLAQAGRPVTVIDRGQAGREASWAAAGMLAPQVEAEPGEEPLLPLLFEARRMWPAFAAELQAAAGMEIGYRTEGTLVVAVDRDERERLDRRCQYLAGLGLGVTAVTGRQARELEPCLSPAVVSGIWSPDDHQVDNRALVGALRTAFTGAGGRLVEHTPVVSLVRRAGRVAGVVLEDGKESAADTVILAAGAWSGRMAGLPEEWRLPVRPVKGQMLSLRMPAARPLISRVVWGPDIYLVPRRDGRLLVGATVEEVGFDVSLTAGGIFDLLQAAWRTLPGTYDLQLLEVWAGLRPTSSDDAPILGPAGIDGLVVATGHHRNGILLTPLTAAAISEFVLRGRLPASVSAFTTARFLPREEAGS